MTHLINDPRQFPAESLRGMVAANRTYMQPVHGGVVRTTTSPHGEVSVVVGGGSGHYPAFAGWVGPGMAHGAVCGNIFASPSASQVESVVRAADNGGGCLLLFGNYAGDVLHFGMARDALVASGLDTRIVTVSDDVASNTVEHHDDRRGRGPWATRAGRWGGRGRPSCWPPPLPWPGRPARWRWTRSPPRTTWAPWAWTTRPPPATPARA